MNPLRILLIEDDRQVLDVLEERLRKDGFNVTSAESGRLALEALTTTLFDAALVDINLPDMAGIEILAAIKRQDHEIDVVMMTGYPEVESAVQALRLGAYDYLTKPLEPDTLRHLLQRIAERRYLRAEVVTLRERLASSPAVDELVGRSPLLQNIRDTIAKVADSDSAILIDGESGTGKEVVAYSIHHLSSRSKKPFVAVNCAAIPADLLESELFGHVKGAFSSAAVDSKGLFRSAEGGTLFLDEIGDLPLLMQPKLLRALQEKEVRPVGSSQDYPVNVRIVAATNQNLDAAVRSGKFRQDLFFRLNVVRIEPPPLRRIKEDIPMLAMHIVRKLNRRFARQVQSIAPDAMATLTKYDFPGNVRELENILERAYALGANTQITTVDLPSLDDRTRFKPPAEPESQRATMKEFERDLIVETLRVHANDKAATARELGLSERTLYRRLKNLGLS